CGVLGPLMDLYTRRRVTGRERLDDLTGAVVFVANHNSHMDTPVILRALPGRWRRRTAVAAAADYFYDKRRNALSASLVFGTVPLDRNSGAGVRPRQTAHLDRLIRDGGSLLVFPEGTRSRDGRVGRLRSGAALLAAEHRLPIVPIYMSGTREAMPRGHRWMVFKAGRPGPRHQLEIRFGKPIAPRPGEPPSEVMELVKLFLADCGAETEREPHPERARRRQPA
ncbi:MAG: lysophospholipid acyltransferase family protein, partial [Thermoleophilaceae bacterium]